MSSIIRGRLWVWGPAWAMMVLIFALSSLSELPDSPVAMDDSVPHAVEYGVLAALLLRGLAGAQRSGVTARTAGLAVLLASVYGVTDEVHQRFVDGRTAEVADLVADAVGATVAAGLVWGGCAFVVKAPRPG